MKVVIAGGTGFIGRGLVEALARAGYQLVVLSRRPESAKASLRGLAEVVSWEPGWEQSLEGAEAVINLAGEPIADRRWTAKRKQLIQASRVETTRAIVAAIGKAKERPRLLVNGSAVGYYGPTEQPVNESSPPGSDFLAQVCAAWEEAAKPVRAMGVRLVCLRIGVVLGEQGGALGRMMLPFKLSAGGPLGSGKQPFPWIHLDDVIGLIRFALEHPEVNGPVNAVAPQRLTNAEFARALGEAMGRPSWLPAPAFALSLALGEMAEAMLLSGQSVEPAAARQHGYSFRHPTVGTALALLVKR